MEKYTWTSHSPEETFEFGERLAKFLVAGDVLTLEGDLGAGKTSFTKGIGKGLGVKRVINSPTFTIIKEYRGSLPLYHMDVYRLEHSEEDLGFDEYFEGEGVTVVEWASMITDMLPSERLEIYIYHNGNEERTFELRPKGERFISLCKELLQ
ncbi:tRNA (adenosine(37)-N6)-threonylcarbamoyltransferase complex ATPase subunit type 1 TsaE [Alkalihalobacterium elongatum]|uniref:tRNA (adenosine(37)-N6)-threonylcarbamoyltransferase complex ATPase subunit type 1 TsaE n=1 Tax=Alkalihalobacterium elongatum TaxID=2675466 RepID=UPI001C1F3156|nr:tRNA (adenosine(37)-N6)-threonylcarbamoyltransferase complex ATPase subunit type 1 TsaE [Alkalihalobacterium elongatum]